MIEVINNFSVLILGLLALWTICFLLEKIKPIHKNKIFTSKYMYSELCFPIFNKIITSTFFNKIIVFLFLASFAKQYLPLQIFNEQIQGLHILLQIFIALFLLDLLIYVRHYFMHVFLWKTHAIHHCPKQINWLTAYRLHPLEILISSAFEYLVLYMLGFDGNAIIYAGIILAIFNIYTHLNINIEYSKPFKYLIACPNYHRWHHATNKEAVNKNFVVVFPIIDIIFKTY